MSPRADGHIEFCTRCGKPLYRSPSKRRGRPFCSQQCHMKTLNEELNPTRMTPETRAKLREARLGTGKGVTYTKIYGRHAHRVIAEEMLGRPLQPGEIVHHIDGDKRNNSPENLEVLDSQSVHARLHMRQKHHPEGGEPDAV